jgi:hypothetical protein
MDIENKDTLFKTLCTGFPYGLKCKIDLDGLLEAFPEYKVHLLYAATLVGVDLQVEVGEKAYTLFGIPCKYRVHLLELDDFFDDYGVPIELVKPYLRPMSSMTEEELKEYENARSDWYDDLKTYDWLDAHHFDYRGLIPMGLALEATKNMYDI